jgi:tol-pal system protein YbgF
MRRVSPLAVLLFAGCVSSSDIEKLQSQISELQDELAGVKRTTAAKEEVQNVNQRIAEQTEQLLRSNGALVAKVDQIDVRVQNTQGSIEQTNYRIDKLGEQVAQAQRDIETLKSAATAPATEISVAPPLGIPAAQPAQPAEDPVAMYQAAYRDYQRGNFDLAIAGFQDYLAKHPDTDLSDNAAFWWAESLYSQKKFPEAIAQFDVVVSKYPRSDKVPTALLKKGYAYINLGERAQGIVQLQYVLHEHPNSPEAPLARQRLRSLGVETR